jgi:thioredoxin-related protein
MTTVFRPLLLLLVVPTLLLARPSHAQSDPDAWVDKLPVHTMADAFDAAAAADKFIFVYVYAPWCPYCQRIEQDVYTDADVQQLMNEHFVMVRVNGDDPEETHQFRGEAVASPALMDTLGARGFPTLAFMEPSGEIIGTLPGAVERDDFMLLMRYVGTGAFRDQSLDAFADQ